MLRPFALAAACVTVLSAAAAQACPNFAWLPAPVAASVPGMRVAIDPVDGTLSMPAPDEFAQEIVIEQDAPVSTFRRADGSVRAQLDDRFAEFAVATLAPNGKPAWTCVSGIRGASQFMKSPAVPAASKAPVMPAPPAGLVWEDR